MTQIMIVTMVPKDHSKYSWISTILTLGIDINVFASTANKIYQNPQTAFGIFTESPSAPIIYRDLNDVMANCKKLHFPEYVYYSQYSYDWCIEKVS